MKKPSFGKFLTGALIVVALLWCFVHFEVWGYFSSSPPPPKSKPASSQPTLSLSGNVIFGLVGALFLLTLFGWKQWKKRQNGKAKPATVTPPAPGPGTTPPVPPKTFWGEIKKTLWKETGLEGSWRRILMAIIGYTIIIWALATLQETKNFWDDWRMDPVFFYWTLVGFLVVIGGFVLARKGKDPATNKETEPNNVLRFFMFILLTILVISVINKLQKNDVLPTWSSWTSKSTPSPTHPPAAAVLMPEMTPSGPVTLNICAPADRWSNAIVIPPGCHWGIHPRGLIRVRNLRGKEWDDGPGMMTPNIKLGNTVLDRTLSFISREKDQSVQVEVTYEPS